MKFSSSGSGPAIGVSKNGRALSGSIVVAPLLAESTAICVCAAAAYSPADALALLVRNVRGFFGTAGLVANARSLRT